MTVVEVVLTLTAYMVLTAVAAFVIRRLNSLHAGRIAAHSYGRPLPGRRPESRVPSGPRGAGRGPGDGAAPPVSAPPDDGRDANREGR
ncbi:hypothetical protein ABZS84_07150 [Streptomyces sp. NPDC005481]|uniref:hypothetical protein n=1 Tax=Streptomyces sp. NPDC005481 TaxID=3154881 RepID=UPI0033A34D9C